MFRGLTDFGRQRTLIEAIGFYLAYLLLGIALSAGLGFLASFVDNGFGFERGLMLGSFVAIGICPVITFAILRAKGLLRHVGYLFVAVLSVAGAAAGGLILGLIFVAFLTTRRAVSFPEPAEVGPTFA
jgi:hypothetical protein